MPDIQGRAGQVFKLTMAAFASSTAALWSTMNDVWQQLLDNDAVLYQSQGTLSDRIDGVNIGMTSLDTRVDALEAGGAGGSTSAGYSVVTTTSGAWTADSAQLAGCVIPAPAGTSVCISSGALPSDSVTGGIGSRDLKVQRYKASGDPVPSGALSAEWAVFDASGSGGSTPPAGPQTVTAASGGGTLSSHSGGTPGTNNVQDTYAVVRPGGAAAGASVRISGSASNGGSYGAGTVTVRVNDGGVITTVGSFQPSPTGVAKTNVPFLFSVASPPAGNWTLVLDFTPTPSQLSSDMDALVTYSLTVDYVP